MSELASDYLREQQHPDFGELCLTIFLPRGEPRETVVLFTLKVVAGLRLRRCCQPDGYSNTLREQYQWYHKHHFQGGDRLAWHSSTVLPSGEQNIGPWQLWAEKSGEEIAWDIPAFQIVVPPHILLHHSLQDEKHGKRLELWVENREGLPCSGLLLQASMNADAGGSAQQFSGPVELHFDLSAHTVAKWIYLVQGPGMFYARISHAGRLLVDRDVPITSEREPQSCPVRENPNVAIEITNARGTRLVPKRGYFCVSPTRKLIVNINPRGNRHVPAVRNVRIEHPSISIAATGKSDDNVFSYTMEFLPSSPLTTRVIVLYTVEYQDAEVRPHTIAFKLKASVFGLLLLGFLFIAPNLVELIFNIDGRRKFYGLILVLCVLIPLIYDRFRSFMYNSHRR